MMLKKYYHLKSTYIEKIGEKKHRYDAAHKNSDIKCSKFKKLENVWFVSSIELMLNEVMRSKGVPSDPEKIINSFLRGGKKSKKYRKRRIRPIATRRESTF